MGARRIASIPYPSTRVETTATTIYYVKGSCALNGSGTSDVCATVAGGVGAFKTIRDAAARTNLVAGSVIRIHGGTYNQQVIPRSSNVTYEPFGDGDVVIDGAATSYIAGTAPWYFVNPESTGWNRGPGANNVTVRSLPTGSKLRIVNSRDFGMIVWGKNFSNPYVSSQKITIDGVVFANNVTGFFAANADGLTVRNVSSTSNKAAGGWIWDTFDFSVKNSSFLNNTDRSGNDDGLAIQSGGRGLIERNAITGGFDGLDLGAQGAIEGPRWVLVRYNRLRSNTNGNSPHSNPSHLGSVTYAYNELWNNCNWGSQPVYEWNTWATYPSVVPTLEWWNNAFSNTVCYGVNGITGSGPAIPGNVEILIANNISRATTSRWNFPAANMTQLNNSTTAVFANEAAGDFTLVAGQNTAQIDTGTFFTKTATAETNDTVVALPVNPLTYFRVGDSVEFQGTNLKRTVVAMSATTITLNSPITVPQNTGIHYPYCGLAPDRGSRETCPTGETP